MLWTIAVAGAATLAIAGLAYASSSSPKLTKPVTVHVIEHADTDTVVDTGGTGDTTGDLLTFHNKVYNSTNKYVVGSDQGVCTRIDPAAGTWECNWTVFLKGGQITVDGPFFDTHDSTLAVTGGTGKYRNARGQMLLKSIDGGVRYHFIYQLLP
jgi:hypothetical protein